MTIKERILTDLKAAPTTGPRTAAEWATRLGCSPQAAWLSLQMLTMSGAVTATKVGTRLQHKVA